MKQPHILLILTSIILVGSLILFIDKTPEEEQEWRHCFSEDFRNNEGTFNIEMKFLHEKEVLSYDSSMTSFSSLNFPPDTQIFEEVIRTLRNVEISQQKFEDIEPTEFGLGQNPSINVSIRKPGDKATLETLQIGNNTPIGYSTYVDCNNVISHTRNTLHHGIPQDLLSYKDLRIFPYSLRQFKSITISDITFEHIDGQWKQIQPYRVLLDKGLVTQFLQAFVQFEGTDVTLKNENPLLKSSPNNQQKRGRIELEGEENEIEFILYENEESTNRILSRGLYDYMLTSKTPFHDFDISSLYSNKLSDTMEKSTKLEFIYKDMHYIAEKEGDANNNLIWNDDGKLLMFLGESLQFQRNPTWQEMQPMENQCSPDVEPIGKIRIYVENRFVEHQLCYVKETLYLSSSFEDGIIQIMQTQSQIEEGIKSIFDQKP